MTRTPVQDGGSSCELCSWAKKGCVNKGRDCCYSNYAEEGQIPFSSSLCSEAFNLAIASCLLEVSQKDLLAPGNDLYHILRIQLISNQHSATDNDRPAASRTIKNRKLSNQNQGAQESYNVPFKGPLIASNVELIDQLDKIVLETMAPNVKPRNEPNTTISSACLGIGWLNLLLYVELKTNLNPGVEHSLYVLLVQLAWTRIDRFVADLMVSVRGQGDINATSRPGMDLWYFHLSHICAEFQDLDSASICNNPQLTKAIRHGCSTFKTELYERFKFDCKKGVDWQAAFKTSTNALKSSLSPAKPWSLSLNMDCYESLNEMEHYLCLLVHSNHQRPQCYGFPLPYPAWLTQPSGASDYTVVPQQTSVMYPKQTSGLRAGESVYRLNRNRADTFLGHQSHLDSLGQGGISSYRGIAIQTGSAEPDWSISSVERSPGQSLVSPRPSSLDLVLDYDQKPSHRKRRYGDTTDEPMAKRAHGMVSSLIGPLVTAHLPISNASEVGTIAQSTDAPLHGPQEFTNSAPDSHQYLSIPDAFNNGDEFDTDDIILDLPSSGRSPSIYAGQLSGPNGAVQRQMSASFPPSFHPAASMVSGILYTSSSTCSYTCDSCGSSRVTVAHRNPLTTLPSDFLH